MPRKFKLEVLIEESTTENYTVEDFAEIIKFSLSGEKTKLISFNLEEIQPET